MDSHLLILVTGIRPGNGPKSMSDTLALPSAMYFEIKQTAFTFFKRIAFAVCTPNLNEASSQREMDAQCCRVSDGSPFVRSTISPRYLSRLID